MPPRKRAAPKKGACKLMCCTTPPAAVEKIRADLEEWKAGEWAERISPGPTCSCTLANAKGCVLHGTERPTAVE